MHVLIMMVVVVVVAKSIGQNCLCPVRSPRLEPVQPDDDNDFILARLLFVQFTFSSVQVQFNQSIFFSCGAVCVVLLDVYE